MLTSITWELKKLSKNKLKEKEFLTDFLKKNSSNKITTSDLAGTAEGVITENTTTTKSVNLSPEILQTLSESAEKVARLEFQDLFKNVKKEYDNKIYNLEKDLETIKDLLKVNEVNKKLEEAIQKMKSENPHIKHIFRHIENQDLVTLAIVHDYDRLGKAVKELNSDIRKIKKQFSRIQFECEFIQLNKFDSLNYGKFEEIIV